ncbi:MAG: hypothetical protein V1645_00995 [archaeon]
MSKKGQIYIIAAILLSVVIFAIASVTNVAKQEKFKGDFEKLSRNYETEGSRLINTVVNTGEDVGPRFGNFTYAFTSYSKTQNPQFGLIYVLDYNNRVYIGNYLPNDIYVDYGGPELMDLSGCFSKVGTSVTFGALTASFDTGVQDLEKCVKDMPEPPSKRLFVSIGEAWYPFELVSGKPQLMVVSQMEQAEQRKVFVGGEGFVKEAENYCTEVLKGMAYGQQICKALEEYGGPCYWDESESHTWKCKQKLESIEELKEEISGEGAQDEQALQEQINQIQEQIQNMYTNPPQGMTTKQIQEQIKSLQDQKKILEDQLKKLNKK